MSKKKGVDYIGVGAGAVIINEENNILLLKRKKPPEKGHWTIPGGTVEFGETVEDALLREVKEELGVTALIKTLLGVTNHILPKEKVHWVSPSYLVIITEGIPKNMEKDAHEKMCWFPLSDLPSNITMTTSVALINYKKWLDSTLSCRA